MDEEGPRSKAQGLPGVGNGVLARKSLIYNMSTTAATKPEFVVTNYCKLPFKVTSKESRNILFKWEATASALFKDEQGIKSYWWENHSKPLSEEVNTFL